MYGFVHWFLIGWFIWSALSVVARVGKEREPITPQTATISVVLSLGLAIMVTVWL